MRKYARQPTLAVRRAKYPPGDRDQGYAVVTDEAEHDGTRRLILRRIT